VRLYQKIGKIYYKGFLHSCFKDKADNKNLEYIKIYKIKFIINKL